MSGNALAQREAALGGGPKGMKAVQFGEHAVADAGGDAVAAVADVAQNRIVAAKGVASAGGATSLGGGALEHRIAGEEDDVAVGEGHVRSPVDNMSYKGSQKTRQAQLAKKAHMLAPAPHPVYDSAMIDAAQVRAARGLLKWTQQDLAGRSGVSLATIKNFEGEIRDTRGSNLRAIQEAFEAAGLFFQEIGDTRPGGRGVRFREPHSG